MKKARSIIIASKFSPMQPLTPQQENRIVKCIKQILIQNVEVTRIGKDLKLTFEATADQVCGIDDLLTFAGIKVTVIH